jgi:hypothetical protein
MSKNEKNRMKKMDEKWMKKIGKSRPNHEVNANAKANSPMDLEANLLALLPLKRK